MTVEKVGRWRRRSAARPGEIAEAALVEFGDDGFAGARLEDIAARAGVSKAALYRYYPTKTDLFRAVLAARASPGLAQIWTSAGEAGDSLSPGLPPLLERVLGELARAVERVELRRLARVVVAESGNFPQLAALWRESVVEPAVAALSGLIAGAQARGEMRPGDPRLMAFSVIGPVLLSVLWKEVMEPAGGAPLDISSLAAEHARTLRYGIYGETGAGA